MESRFGHDFSRVRVHTDARAAESASRVDARAYTVGRDIVFGSAQYAPASGSGRRLLAHELAHTIQQAASAAGAGAPVVGSPGDALETEAERSAAAVTNGAAAPGPVTRGPRALQRQPAPGATTERDRINAALKSKDPGDVKAIQDVNQATESEKIELIRILLDQWWVGPYDEKKLEELWASFGDQLFSVIGNNKRLWTRSIEAGAELDAAFSAGRTRMSGLEATAKKGSGKTFGEVGSAITRLSDMRHDLNVLEKGTGLYEGNRCAVPTPGVTHTDCTLFVLEVLGKVFEQQGRAADWARVKKKYEQNKAAHKASLKGLTGLDVQRALQSELGWQAIYWAPDPAYLIPADELSGHDPSTGGGIQSDEAGFTSKMASRKKGTYYKVPVTQSVTNYAPEMPREPRKAGYPGPSKTKKDTSQLMKLKKLPFGVLTAHGGHHMTLITYGKVIEVHWDLSANNVNVIQQSDLEQWAVGSQSGYHFFASGLILAPAEDVAAAFK